MCKQSFLLVDITWYQVTRNTHNGKFYCKGSQYLPYLTPLSLEPAKGTDKLFFSQKFGIDCTVAAKFGGQGRAAYRCPLCEQ